jgi:anti-anti-sigma regulatory factor
MDGGAAISFSAEPSRCILRLAGALGVANAEDLRLTSLGLVAYRQDVAIDWSGATQLDASVAQVLLALRAVLVEQGHSLVSSGEVPSAVESWLRTAGLADLLANPGRSE